MGLPLVCTLGVEVVSGQRGLALRKLQLVRPVLWDGGGQVVEDEEEDEEEE